MTLTRAERRRAFWTGFWSVFCHRCWIKRVRTRRFHTEDWCHTQEVK